MNSYFSKRESAWSWQLCKELQTKTTHINSVSTFLFWLTACIFGNYSYDKGAILSKLSVNKHWRSNWLNHFSYIYFVNISSWCNFVFRLLSFNEGALTRDTFDEIPWATKPSSLLLFFGGNPSLLNPALTERKECFQRSPNLGMPYCLDVLPHLVACPPCPLVGTGGAGNRTGLSRCRCWARTRWAACWADAGQPWQDVSRCPRAPTRCWAWAVFDQDQKRDRSPQPPLHLYHQKGLLSHHHLLLVLNSSLNHYLAQTCINKSDFPRATSSAHFWVCTSNSKIRICNYAPL